MADKRGLLACLIAIFISNGVLLANSDGWVIKQITNSGYITPFTVTYAPDMAVSGKNIVWIEMNKRLMFFDGNVTKQITDGTKYVIWPLISGNNVVWMQYTDEAYQIMLWNGATIKQISSGNNQHYLFGISGNNVIWVESPQDDYFHYQLILYDGSITKQLSNEEGSCYWAQISGTNVVWVQDTNDVHEVMFWDGNTVRQIAQGNGFSEVQISGKNVVWCEYINSRGQIVFWNGQTARQISDGNNDNYSPQISGKNVAWIEAEEGFDYMMGQVMFWNGGTVKQLTANLKQKYYLSISGSNIVWSETPISSQRDGITLIYYWDGKTAEKLTEVDGWCMPFLSGSNVAFKALDENYDYQIFSACRHSNSGSNRNK